MKTVYYQSGTTCYSVVRTLATSGGAVVISATDF